MITNKKLSAIFLLDVNSGLALSEGAVDQIYHVLFDLKNIDMIIGITVGLDKIMPNCTDLDLFVRNSALPKLGV